MFKRSTRILLGAALGVLVMAGAAGRSDAVAQDLERSQISRQISDRFQSEITANPQDAFQIFQFYLINFPRAASALTSQFMRGREDLAPSIGAAAVVALSGSWASDQEIAAQVKSIARYISDASPEGALDTYSAMTAAAPNFSGQILDGLVQGAPQLESQLSISAVGTILASYSQTTGTDATSSDYAGEEPLLAEDTESGGSAESDSDAPFELSESQVSTCLSEPCT